MSRTDFIAINSMFEESIVEILVKPPNKRTEHNLTQLARMFAGLSFFHNLVLEVARTNAMRYLRFEKWNADHELFHSGQPGDMFYILVRGEVKIMEGSVHSGNYFSRFDPPNSLGFDALPFVDVVRMLQMQASQRWRG